MKILILIMRLVKFMPKSSKPIVCICGSRSINNLNLDFYLNPTDYSEVVCGGANGVDTFAEKWAKRHGLEFVAFLPQYQVYGGKYAPLKRDEDLVAYCDIVVAFWDGKSNGTKYTIDFAAKLGVPVYLHLIEDLDVI